MSDERDEASDEQPSTTQLVQQPHGGAIRSGGRHERIDMPTDTDCADAARKVLYSVIPALRRMATNTQVRTKPGDRRTKLKRPYSVNAQLKAISELRMIAMMDRTLREGRVTSSLFATRDEILEFFDSDRNRAEALMAKIAPHWLGI
jgi:hypothetical protein